MLHHSFEWEGPVLLPSCLDKQHSKSKLLPAISGEKQRKKKKVTAYQAGQTIIETLHFI